MVKCTDWFCQIQLCGYIEHPQMSLCPLLPVAQIILWFKLSRISWNRNMPTLPQHSVTCFSLKIFLFMFACFIWTYAHDCRSAPRDWRRLVDLLEWGLPVLWSTFPAPSRVFISLHVASFYVLYPALLLSSILMFVNHNLRTVVISIVRLSLCASRSFRSFFFLISCIRDI